MIHAVDSSFARPTAASVAALKASGFRIWSGYIATTLGVGLETTWTKADFDQARQLGGMPIAYCSGWDDPTKLKALAAQWNVRLCLDVESGIRGDGPWVQAFLDASGAGLYGNLPVHTGRNAPFHILAAYPDQSTFVPATWSGPRPNTPCGWQYHGTITVDGVSVDLSWLDDWFLGEEMTKDLARGLVRQFYLSILHREPESEAALASHANTIMTSGYEAWIVSIVDTGKAPEANNDIAAEQKLIATETAVAALQTAIASISATNGGVTIDQVKAEIIKALKAGEAGA